ncbi:MAG: FlgD immunoglobulin-like domain containing protein [bacterium]|nr:FlgD immunoglobulin-like domain containing protein [bacterium]
MLLLLIKKIKILPALILLLMFSSSLRATILYNFETVNSNSAWEKDWGFAANPVWSSTYSYKGNGSVKYTNTMIHDWNGAGKRYHGDPGLNLSRYSNLSMWIRTPDTIINGTTYMVFQVFTRSGGAAHSWTNSWGPELQGFLTPGTWYHVTMAITNIKYPDNVNDIAFQVKNFNTTNFSEVYMDLVEAFGTNSVPENITCFTARSTGASINLTWKTPYNSDLFGTMVRYRTNGFPSSRTNGLLLFVKNGLPGTVYYTNHTGLISGTTYYYSAFSVNVYSNYSLTNSSSKASALYLSMNTNVPYGVRRFLRASQEIIRYGSANTVAYNAMSLFWDPPAVNLSFVDYVLYRATEPLSTANIADGSAANLTAIPISDGYVTSYVDTSVPSFSTRYYYALHSDYGSALKTLSRNIASLVYIPEDYHGWVYKKVTPAYVWKEAESYSVKNGISEAYYSTASGGVLMENFEDESTGAYIEYSVTVPEDMVNAYFYLRNSVVNYQAYLNVYVDGNKKISSWPVNPVGTDWYAFNFQNILLGDGSLSKGTHTVKITRTGYAVNLDGFFIYDNLYNTFEPDNTLYSGSVAMPPDVEIKVRNIALDYNAKSKVMTDPYYSKAAHNPGIKDPQALTAYDISLEGKPGILFNKLLNFTMDYTESDMPAGVREDDLQIFYWDGEDWHKVGGDLDKDGNLINAQINHFGLYAVYAANSLDTDFKWSYNPFLPNGSGNYQKSTMSFYLEKSSFVRVRIFNLSGRLMRTLLEQQLQAGPVSVEWDARDSNNKNVPIGVYVYQVEGAGDKVHTGTITILR